MRLCDYGCGNNGIYKLKNGKSCCSKSPNSCPKNKEKNSIKHKNHKEYKECPYCHKKIVSNIGGHYTEHITSCEKIYSKKIFLESKDQTKYLKWYNNIILNRQNNPLIGGYKEKHHIIPRSLGGSNEHTNLIYLTAREHYICHMLLVEIYRKDKESFLKMLSAFMMMKTRSINSKLYEKYKIEYSKNKKDTGCGTYNNNYGNMWISNPLSKETILIKKELLDEYSNNGWIKGRIINWNTYYAKLNKIRLDSEYYNDIKGGKSVEQIAKEKELKRKEREYKYNETKQLYLKYYEVYKIYGYTGVVEQFGYDKSRINLVQQFHRYVEDYKPKNK